MGEKEEPKAEKENEKKAEGGENKKKNEEKKEEKKEEGNKTPEMELKVDMHCDGCAQKMKRAIRNSIEGVEKVSMDPTNTKLRVVGNVDPWKVKEFVESKTKKKVDFISPKDPPKKKDTAGEAKPPAKEEKKKEDKAQVTKVLLKMRLHCEGCISRIRRTIYKIKGVEEVNVEREKDIVSVKGTMDVKSMVETLGHKLKRPIEIVKPKPEEKKQEEKEKPASDGEKKEKEGGGGGEGKEKGGEKKEGGEKVTDADKAEVAAAAMVTIPPISEVNKMDFHGGYVNGFGYPIGFANPVGYPNGFTYPNGFPNGFTYPNGIPNEYSNYGYRVDAMPMHAMPIHAPQTFSDENPNACSVM